MFWLVIDTYRLMVRPISSSTLILKVSDSFRSVPSSSMKPNLSETVKCSACEAAAVRNVQSASTEYEHSEKQPDET